VSEELEPRCITCGDLAEEVAIVALEPAGLACCRTDAGRETTVDIGLIAEPEVGDRVLVHAGAAIAKLAPTPERSG
jgi:hydrogenase maturation factor